jgi:hypothetical protein
MVPLAPLNASISFVQITELVIQTITGSFTALTITSLAAEFTHFTFITQVQYSNATT